LRFWEGEAPAEPMAKNGSPGGSPFRTLIESSKVLLIITSQVTLSNAFELPGLS